MRRIISIFAGALGVVLATNSYGQAIDIFGGANFDAPGVLGASGGVSPIDEEDIFKFLQTIPGAFQNPDLLPPTRFVTDITNGSVNADAGDYLFILYGSPGEVNVPPSGNVAVIFFPVDQDGYTFDQPSAPGFAKLYDHVPAPDGGLTLAMLGLGFAGATFARRIADKRK